MPKLSHDSLKKRFPCIYCAQTFRTRQGLSGHIQFKHLAPPSNVYQAQWLGPDVGGNVSQENHPGEKLNVKYFSSRLVALAGWRITCQLPQSTIEAIGALMLNWRHVEHFCTELDIELTNQDFKTYLLSGLGKLFIERRL